MTMDGFWYDVVDDLGSLYEKIFGEGSSKELALVESKKDYYRKKKMMTPSTANERAQQNHEDFVKEIDHNQAIEQNNNDVFQPVDRHAGLDPGCPPVGKIVISVLVLVYGILRIGIVLLHYLPRPRPG